MNLRDLINSRQESFSETEKEILNYMLDNQLTVESMTISSLAAAAHVSKSSVIRLTKKLGFSGYSELKYFLKSSKDNPNNNLYDVLANQRKDLEDTKKYLDQLDFEPFIHLLANANIVYCYGTGYAQKNAANEFSKSLLGCQVRSMVLPAKTEFDVSMSAFTKQDLVIFISLSGETDEMKEDLKILKLRQIPFVTITEFSQNYMSSLANYSLHYHVTPMVIHGQSRQLHSFITLNLLLDTVIRRYIVSLGEEQESST